MKDIESLFQGISAGNEGINMSVDAMTGWNPSYCFVDFTSRELADRVMEEYNGRDFLRRTLKVKSGVKSRKRTSAPTRQLTASQRVYHTIIRSLEPS